MNSINTIIWDWNGTLLDDVNICLDAINILLKERQLPFLHRDKYLEIFDFPVKDYYRRIGFNFGKEPFKIPADQFIEIYTSKLNKTKLQKNAINILERFHTAGYRQFVLSASEQNKLVGIIKDFKIDGFFEKVVGLNDDYANSKINLGIELLDNININRNEVCLIGDTCHDYEVAKSLGIKCMLIAQGHQSVNRLQTTGSDVFENLIDLALAFKM